MSMHTVIWFTSNFKNLLIYLNLGLDLLSQVSFSTTRKNLSFRFSLHHRFLTQCFISGLWQLQTSACHKVHTKSISGISANKKQLAEEVPWSSLDLQSMGLGATWSEFWSWILKYGDFRKLNPTFDTKSWCFRILDDFMMNWFFLLFPSIFAELKLDVLLWPPKPCKISHAQHLWRPSYCKLSRLHPDWHTIDTTQPFKFALQVEEDTRVDVDTGGQKWDAFSLQAQGSWWMFLIART